MFKYICLFVLLVIKGCSSNAVNSGGSGELTKQESEKLLTVANNHLALVDFYKSELKATNSPEARYKLASSYLKISDPESALFYLEPAIKVDMRNPDYLYLQATAYYDLGEIEEANKVLRDLVGYSPTYASAYNFMGVIYAGQGDLVGARNAFSRARALMLDDITVKNNLAVIDIIEEDYDMAIKRLMPLYINGSSDERVKANLLIAMVKAGQFEQFKQLLKSSDEEDAYTLFRALYVMKPAKGDTHVQ